MQKPQIVLLWIWFRRRGWAPCFVECTHFLNSPENKSYRDIWTNTRISASIGTFSHGHPETLNSIVPPVILLLIPSRRRRKIRENLNADAQAVTVDTCITRYINAAAFSIAKTHVTTVFIYTRHIYTHTRLCARTVMVIYTVNYLWRLSVPYPINYLGPVPSSLCLLWYTRCIIILPPDKWVIAVAPKCCTVNADRR